MVVTLLAAGIGLGVRATGGCGPHQGALATTVGDLRTMHAEVSVGGKEVRGEARLRFGDLVKVGPAGRARVRLDDGTQVVVDGNTEFTIDGAKLDLHKGRIFVQAGGAARTEVAFAGASTTIVSSAAAFEVKDGSTGKVYCTRGELVLVSSGGTAHVPSGETADLAGGHAKVAPEAAFDDWTGGLATPWSGERGPRSAIPELWAGAGGADPGAPLVVRSETVQVAVDGELAITRTKTTYFNGSDQSAQADVRLALPAGALVSRVARLNEGESTPAEATLGPGKMGAPGTSGRLEWAGDGWLRGTLVNIAAGKSVDLLIEYAEWLPIRGGRATYRFPMASDQEAPMVGGLSVMLDTSSPLLSANAGVTLRRGGLDFRRADVRPTGDLVVELEPKGVKAGEVRAYLAPGEGKDDPYVLFRTEVPDASEAGVTLAVVVDSSMSTGPALLETERVVVGSLLEAMGPKDSVVVLAADQSARSVGPNVPTLVTPEVKADIRKALASVRPGGASNLGLALEQAADLLDRQDKERAGAGMVVYIGDGRPTVGEATARDLRKRLSRRAGGVPAHGLRRHRARCRSRAALRAGPGVRPQLRGARPARSRACRRRDGGRRAHAHGPWCLVRSRRHRRPRVSARSAYGPGGRDHRGLRASPRCGASEDGDVALSQGHGARRRGEAGGAGAAPAGGRRRQALGPGARRRDLHAG